MSRSRKKTPIMKFGGLPGGKTANRKVRHNKFADTHKGNLYKKVYPQYNVNDYVWYCPKKRAEQCPYMDADEWETHYHRK